MGIISMKMQAKRGYDDFLYRIKENYKFLKRLLLRDYDSLNERYNQEQEKNRGLSLERESLKKSLEGMSWDRSFFMKRVGELEGEKTNLNVENADLASKLDLYKQEATKTPEYLELRKMYDDLFENSRELELNRVKIERVAEDRGRLIDHLKNDKRGLVSLVNQVIGRSAEPLVDFLATDKYYSKESLAFLNSKGEVVSYTGKFAEVVKNEKELVGKNYLKILCGEDCEKIKKVRGLFNTKSEIDFYDEFPSLGGRYHIIKRRAISIKNLDLTMLGFKKGIEAIAIVPISVEPAGRIESFFGADLEKRLKQYKKERDDMYLSLITDHKWTDEMIVKRETEIGYYSLRDEFVKLQVELKQKRKEKRLEDEAKNKFDRLTKRKK